MLVDCQPSLGLLTINALTAAHGVIIPLECEYFALRGVALLVSTIEKVRERLNPDLQVEGILATMYDARTIHAREVLARLVESFGDQVFHTVIAKTVRFPETTVAGEPITTYASSSPGAAAYRDLARELLARRADRVRRAEVLYALGDPVSFVVLVLSFLLAATLHGWVQALVAARTGDRRPAAQGRTRPDPRRHVDPFGAVAAAIAGVGWARPLEPPDRRRRGALVAVLLSGAVANLVVGFAAARRLPARRRRAHRQPPCSCCSAGSARASAAASCCCACCSCSA